MACTLQCCMHPKSVSDTAGLYSVQDTLDVIAVLSYVLLFVAFRTTSSFLALHFDPSHKFKSRVSLAQLSSNLSNLSGTQLSYEAGPNHLPCRKRNNLQKTP